MLNLSQEQLAEMTESMRQELGANTEEITAEGDCAAQPQSDYILATNSPSNSAATDEFTII